MLLTATAACGPPHTLALPAGHVPSTPTDPPACAAEAEPLVCFAPIVLQETAPGAAAVLDHPRPLDPDGSGRLDDDAERLAEPGNARVPFYATAASDSARLYLFYALYYPADWSGPPGSPRIDHVGDLEGALLVVSRASNAVEAVVTQAHGLFYLWSPDSGAAHRSRAFSGELALEGGRPVLFAESGGHGLYAWGEGGWNPRGGGRYPGGPAAVPASRLVRIELADSGSASRPPEAGPHEPHPPTDGLRADRTIAALPSGGTTVAAELLPLDDLRRFTDGPGSGFTGLPHGATPPWLWRDRRSRAPGGPGAIILDPSAFYQGLLRSTRP